MIKKSLSIFLCLFVFSLAACHADESLNHEQFANVEREGPLSFYLIASAFMLICICLIVIYRYNLRYINEEKKTGKLKRQLNAAQQTVADYKMEIIALKKDIASMQRSLYNCTDVIVKIRSFNEKSFTGKDKPSLSEQEWHIYFNLLEDTFGFLSRLKHQFPQLTDDDLRICALLKEGVRGAHICTVLGMTQETLTRQMESIKNEKMGLSRQKASLENIIKSF